MLLIPKNVALDLKDEARLKPLVCRSCGARYGDHQRARWENHVVKCSQQHEDQERAMSLRTHLGMYGGEQVVPDLEQWMARNARLVLEGRKKV